MGSACQFNVFNSLAQSVVTALRFLVRAIILPDIILPDHVHLESDTTRDMGISTYGPDWSFGKMMFGKMMGAWANKLRDALLN